MSDDIETVHRAGRLIYMTGYFLLLVAAPSNERRSPFFSPDERIRLRQVEPGSRIDQGVGQDGRGRAAGQLRMHGQAAG